MISSQFLQPVVAACLATLCLAPTAFADNSRNVILIIGDGMDDHQITIARNYLKGAEGRLVLDDMPLRAASQVLTVDETGNRVYVADSANSATSMATGAITSRGRIATTAGTDKSLTTIAEMATAAGFRTGLVTTSSVTDATPASFVAHINVRYCENPEAMFGVEVFGRRLPDCPQHLLARGGLGSIAEQIAASNVDVVLGGGKKHFAGLAEESDETIIQGAQGHGYHVVDTLDDLQQAPAGEKLLGLFADSHLPVRLRGENGREAEKPNPSWLNRLIKYVGSVEQPAAMRCEPNPDYGNTPSLKMLTDIAIARLENERGFFLMVESASIDKQSHERRPCGSIGELEQLEEALQSAMEFASTHTNTLVLVTADHGQAAQMIPDKSLFSNFGVPVYTTGKVARLRTPEGAVMAVNYATNDFAYEEHTGVHIPLFSNSEGLGRVSSMVTQPQIFTVMKDYLGL